LSWKIGTFGKVACPLLVIYSHQPEPGRDKIVPRRPVPPEFSLAEQAAAPARPVKDQSSMPSKTFLHLPGRSFVVVSCIVTTALLLVGPLQAQRSGQDPRGGRAFDAKRKNMVSSQIEARGIDQPGLLSALERVPRHEFLPEAMWDEAYSDQALTLDHGLTMSQPYLVARMTDLLGLDGDEKVLEIGTGSGYHAAILAQVAAEVYTVEIEPRNAERARQVLSKLEYDNVHLRVGDGYNGWPEAGPFDAILLTTAPRKRVPEPLLAQLKVGGRLVAPVGIYIQDLLVLTKTESGVITKSVEPVRVVPMSGVESEHP
jgi:protein-L-isoaspartate(D-aspartate) O-methyltransferase